VRLDGGAVEVGDRDRVGGDHDDLVLPDGHGTVGVFHEGGHIGAEEVLALAQPDHERRVATGAHDDTRLVLMQGEQGESAVQARHHARECGRQAVSDLVLPAEHLRGHLGVGLAVEGEAVFEQLLLQRGEVLDDAVVDQGDPAGVVEVRMGVAVGGAAVRRPAGVPDAGLAVGHRMRVEVVGEHGQLAGALAGGEAPVGADHGHPGGVVTAVLQSAQSAEEHLETAVVADVTHDSTHAVEFSRARPHDC
jgi:hypothetical protein